MLVGEAQREGGVAVHAQAGYYTQLDEHWRHLQQMAGLHLASASDITAEVIAIIDFLGTSEFFGFLLLRTVCKS